MGRKDIQPCPLLPWDSRVARGMLREEHRTASPLTVGRAEKVKGIRRALTGQTAPHPKVRRFWSYPSMGPLRWFCA